MPVHSTTPHATLTKKFPPNLSWAAVSSQTVTITGGYKLSSVPLSRLSPRQQRGASCAPKCLSRHSHSKSTLSVRLTRCPPEHLFLITCLRLCLLCYLLTCLSLVHLPLWWYMKAGLPLHQTNYPENILTLNIIFMIVQLPQLVD